MPQEKTRQEHIEWAKTRAYEYLDLNQPQNALDSLLSDLTKHPETKEHSAVQLGMSLRIFGGLSTAQDVRRFIDGVN